MTEYAVINKPLYFVTSLCAVDACFSKLVITLFHNRYTGEFYCLKWEKLHIYFQAFCTGNYAQELSHPAQGCP